MRKIVMFITVVLVFGILAGVFFVKTTSKQDCLRMKNGYSKITCLKPQLLQMVKGSNAKEALQLAHDYKEKRIIDDCHLLAHFIGEEVVKENNFDLAKSFSQCSDQCIQGCYHGVMEQYLSQTTTSDSLNQTTLDAVCKSFVEEPLAYRQCIHGLGHGLLAHNYLPLEKALNTCELLSSEYDQQTCLGGLFMEHVDSFLTLEKSALEKQLSGICDPFGNSQYSAGCFSALGEGLMFYTGHNFAEVENYCAFLAEGRDICIESAKYQQQVSERNS